MTVKRWRYLVIIVLLAIAVHGVAIAQDTPIIQRSIVPNGAATGAADDIILTSYVGESMATGMIPADDLREGSGFRQEGVGKYWRWVSCALRT